MVPSPDWFIGLDSLNLCQGGHFVDSLTMEVGVGGCDRHYNHQIIIIISNIIIVPKQDDHLHYCEEERTTPTLIIIVVNIISNYHPSLS